MEKIKKYVFSSPLIKSILGVVSIVLTGVLSSGFVAELSSQEVVWSNYFKTKCFYILILYALLAIFYNWQGYKWETSIERIMEKEYCKNFVLKENLPVLAEHCKDLIKTGKIDEFIETTKKIKEL